MNRREFLIGAGALAGAEVLPSLAEARGLLTEPAIQAVIDAVLLGAKQAGCSYADVRIVSRRHQSVSTREDHVTQVGSRESYGMGVRVLRDGAWGFAASAQVERKEAARVVLLAADMARHGAALRMRPVVLARAAPAVDVWQTALSKDPFKIPIADKAELLIAAGRAALRTGKVKYCAASCSVQGEWKLFASSEGACIEQSITRIGPSLSVTCVSERTGEFVERVHELPPMQAGWEYIESQPLEKDAERIAEEAREKLLSPSVAPGPRDLILAPSNLWLTIHESVGHPTELDRALGYEANFAGTSFATPDKLGKLRYASPQVTLYADKTTPGGLATCGYDDDGVPTQRWDLIRDGIFIGYQTTREQAGWIGEKASRGTCYAEDHRSFPFQRMPNVSLKPGPRPLLTRDLIAATEDGIYITGHGSYSIDHQRYNFQFGGQMFYEVRRGRITRAVKDVAYQANTLSFWRSLDLLGGEQEFALHGSMFDGKGEPGQSNAVSHGCPPARFRQVNILNTGRAGRERG